MTRLNQLVAVDLESLGRQFPDFTRTPTDGERLIAVAAEEVEVMRAPGQLVPKPAARKVHFRQPPLTCEVVYVSVAGRKPE